MFLKLDVTWLTLLKANCPGILEALNSLLSNSSRIIVIVIIYLNYKWVLPGGSGTAIRHKKTPWSGSASELYRPNDRRLSAE
jgi:hypothetical protein